MRKINNSASKVKQIKEKIAERSKFDSKPVMAASAKPSTPAELAVSISDSSAADTNEDKENDETVEGNDDDSVVIPKTPKPVLDVAPVDPFELEKCTTIVFIDLDGNRNEILLDKRILQYSDLQREIAKRTPSTKKMYVIQNAKGQAITAKHFVDGEDTSILRVKEIGIHSYPPGLKKLHPKWEFEGYHEARTQKSNALVKADSFSDIVDSDDD